MTLTRSLVESSARVYQERGPLYTVEQETVETFSTAIRRGAYGWRDVEWVVQWYYRRHLGNYPDRKRRAVEERFRENDFEDVRDVLFAVVRDGGELGGDGDELGGDGSELDNDELEGKSSRGVLERRVDLLRSLEGIDVRLASAFLLFLYPSRHVVVGEREWGVLVDAGELDAPYPDPPSFDDYRRYHERCDDLMDRFEVDAWTLYQALWQLSGNEE